MPGDQSSAAFLIAAGVLVRDSRLVLEHVGVNWTRAGFLRILERMGAIVLADLEPPGSFGPVEPVADIDVRNAPIEATTVEAEEVPLAIDELPLVALLGCFADGDTVVRGAGELRVKESDRIATVVEGLRGLGAEIEALRRRVRRDRNGPAARRTDRQPRRSPAGAARRRRGPRLRGGRRGGGDGGGRRVLPAIRRGRRGADRVTVVAIDGPAGAGKSTVARAVADELGFTYLDTGAMYRAVALAAMRARRAPAASLASALEDRARRANPARRRDVTDEIRTPEVSEAASRAAADPGVRAAIASEQRRLLRARRLGGRGTRHRHGVAPDAEVKVFLTADPAERARRRAAELGVDAATVLAEQTIRDERDRTREHSPLAPADGAIVLDTTNMTLPQVVRRIVALVRDAGTSTAAR